MSKKIIGKECKNVFWLPKINSEDPDIKREDTHVIKEIIHYDDGTTSKNLRVVENFQRPFWVTKEHYQNHKDKKEAEFEDRLNKYTSTQSDLGSNVAMRLGKRYIGKTSIRDVSDSPYIYGLDINSKTFIKHNYQKHFPDAISEYEVCTLDSEFGVEDRILTILSIAIPGNPIPSKNPKPSKLYCSYTKDYIGKEYKHKDQLKYLFDKYIPKHNLTTNIETEFVCADTEIDVVKNVMAKAHEWQPDIMAVWNIDADISIMLEVCERYGVDPKDIFSDPRLPNNLKHFEYKKGPTKKVTESGVTKNKGFEEQWHSIIAPASFSWVDAGSAHRYIRVGGKTTPGGYSLSNILVQELGKEYDKLHFPTDSGILLDSIDWHKYMSSERKLEYIIYNNWDILSMLVLDNKTTDLKSVMAILSGVSDFDIFDSGPKKLVNAMFFHHLEYGRVLGTRHPRTQSDNLLGLDNWIVLLPTYRINNKGLRLISENPFLRTNMRGHTYDADQVSGYPSNGMAANVSKDTTKRQIMDIAGIDKEVFKLQNINLMFGKVNSLEYCTTMFNFPKPLDVVNEVKEKLSMAA